MNKKAKVTMLPTMEASSQGDVNDAALSYGSNLEYLSDELKKLDLAIKLHFAREQLSDGGNPLAEIALMQEDIGGFLEGLSLLDAAEGDPARWESELLEQERRIEERIQASLRQGVRLMLPRMSSHLPLSPLEKSIIIACLAPELDRKYERIYAFLQNDLSAKAPAPDFLFTLFGLSEEERIAARLLFDPDAPLMKFAMDLTEKSSNNGYTLLARPLKLDDWVVSCLLGFPVVDEHLLKAAKRAEPEDPEYPEGGNNFHRELEEKAIRFVRHFGPAEPEPPSTSVLFYCSGPDDAAKAETALSVCRRLNLPLLFVDTEKLLASEADYRDMLRLLQRHALMEQSALCFTRFDAMAGEDGRHRLKGRQLMEMLRDRVPVTFLHGQAPWNMAVDGTDIHFVQMDFPYPDDTARRAYWKSCAKMIPLAPKADMEGLSGSFRFTASQIRSAMSGGVDLAVWNAADAAKIRVEEKDLYQACYFRSNRNIESLASKIHAAYTWDMLVLPKDQMSQLRDICNQVKYRSVVYGDWGFAKRLSLGKGLNVLFSGPPGAGKTMAAEVIATELGLEMYKVDVSQIVSKYIGETEKNLSKIFDEAETSNAILFFDEADALFGKRSEVKEAHDRYANVEISYLLQKMEEYQGIVILATNLNQNLDEAFLRRLHFKVEFPFPEKDQRERIWRGMFPKGAPLDEDMDFEFMAEKFVMAGGNIKNIALNAAFYAAQASCPIGMKQILMAAKREYAKLGRTFLQSDFEPYSTRMEAT